MSETSPKNSTNKVKKILSITLNAMFYVIITTLLIYAISNINRDPLEIPSFLGTSYLTVETDSMAGNEKDSFTPSDLLVVKKVNDKNRDKMIKDLKIGDIITFEYVVTASRNTVILNTHRIVDIKDDYFITQGDGNVLGEYAIYKYDPQKDDNNPLFYDIVRFDEVKAVYVKHIEGMGNVMHFLQKPIGFLVCIVFPTAILFFIQLFILATNFFKIRQEKLATVQQTELENEKERIRKELEEEYRLKNQKKENEDQ